MVGDVFFRDGIVVSVLGANWDVVFVVTDDDDDDVIMDVVMDGTTSSNIVCIAPRCVVPLMIGPMEMIRYDTHEVRYTNVGFVAY